MENDNNNNLEINRKEAPANMHNWGLYLKIKNNIQIWLFMWNSPSFKKNFNYFIIHLVIFDFKIAASLLGRISIVDADTGE